VTRVERVDKLQSFGRGPGVLGEALRRFPKKMWMYKSLPDRWSIHEIILHLADSEVSSYVRCRRFIAEPAQPAVACDMRKWAAFLGYPHQSTKDALELIHRLRKMTLQLLIFLPESVWSNPALHPEEGAATLDEWLDAQNRHIPHHIEQMTRNYELWLATHPRRKPAKTRRARTLAPPRRGLIPLDAR
jgi:hypothetical protein